MYHFIFHFKENISTAAAAASSMGNCCSDTGGGMAAVGGTAGLSYNAAASSNDAVDWFLKSRGYLGLFSQIEVAYPIFLKCSNLFQFSSL